MKRVGANYIGEGKLEFNLWAPVLEAVSLRLLSDNEKIIPLSKDERGFWSITLDNIAPQTTYFYRIKENLDLPDPASCYQPEGLSGPSMLVDHSVFKWEDQGYGQKGLEEMIIYELHIGTFTPEGTFEAVRKKLDYLCDLEITAIEIMPVSQFSGERGWGYDGVFPFAVHNSYGDPQGLKALINECHKRGLAVILDVVYNHLGPEGNCLPRFMPCFSEKYLTPWGKAINFDGEYSWGIRNFFIQNALFWFQNYHADALRLDAVHGIYDLSAKHFLRELSESVGQLTKEKQRKFHLIAESDLNDVRVIDFPQRGGYGIDAQWNDDFHHCLHVLLTGEKKGYYADFGKISQMAKALTEGFVYTWDFSGFRKKFHGSSSMDMPAGKFVVFSQNHDQVGNRAHGERLSSLVPFEALKLASCVTLFSPFVPLIFMGEEFAEESPFLYFMSFNDENLIKAVRDGRKAESLMDHNQEAPDPYSPETFFRSKIKWEELNSGRHRLMRQFYKKVIRLRKNIPALSRLDKNETQTRVFEDKKLIIMNRSYSASNVCLVFNFNFLPQSFDFKVPEGGWNKLLDSSDSQWDGQGSSVPEEVLVSCELLVQPYSCVLLKKS